MLTVGRLTQHSSTVFAYLPLSGYILKYLSHLVFGVNPVTSVLTSILQQLCRSYIGMVLILALYLSLLAVAVCRKVQVIRRQLQGRFAANKSTRTADTAAGVGMPGSHERDAEQRYQ